jgi:hypothetical protein
MKLDRWASPQMLRRSAASAPAPAAPAPAAQQHRVGDLKLFELIAKRPLITLRDREKR